MNKHYESIHRYDFLTKELLEEEYINNNLTDRQIAEKYNMPERNVVWRKRKKFGIPNKYSAKSNKHGRLNRKFNITKEKAEQMLSDGDSIQDIADYMQCSLMVANRRLKELGLCRETKQTEKYKFWDIKLTDSQRQLILGSTLGDGSLLKQGAYSCSHSIYQEEYHKYKMNILSSIHSGAKQRAIHKACGEDGKPYESIHFTTGCNSELSDLRKIYYPKGTKIFDYFFLKGKLEAQGLAYWYMDDGCFKPLNKNAILCTYGYSTLEHLLMKSMFIKKWGLITAVHIDYSRPINACYHLYFTVAETKKLFDLIRPYIIPSMLYKIGETQ